MLSKWIVSTKESHPRKVVGGIFKEDDKDRVVARVITLVDGDSIFYRGFICGKSSVTKRYNECYYDRTFEIEDDSLYTVVFTLDLKLLEMGYEIKDIGRFI